MKHLLTLMCFIPFIGYSQLFSTMTRVIMQDSISKYIIVDSVEFKLVKLSKDRRQMLVNEMPVDTTDFGMWGNPLPYHGKVFFSAQCSKKTLADYPSIKKIAYSIKNGEVTTFDYEFDYDDVRMIPYIEDRRHGKIYQFNPETGKQKLFADFWDLVKKMTTDSGSVISNEDFQQVFFLDENNLYVTLCYEGEAGTGGCEKTRHFLVASQNRQTDVTKKITPKYNSFIGERLVNYRSAMQFVSADGKYIKDLCYVDIYNVETNTGFNKNISRIFDIQLNFIGEVLPMSDRNYAIDGMNIQKGKIKNYFLRTQTDLTDSTKTKIWGTYPHKYVLIPYRFNPVLEIAMYKAYHNNLLTNNDIQGLQKYELAILRNLIFAKYNYAFSSEFYQAYFNLYEFYGNDKSRKSRVKNVDNLLTEADKANIKLAKDVEAGL